MQKKSLYLWLTCLMVSSLVSSLRSQDLAHPQLFAEEAALPITIETDLKQLIRDDGEERDYHPIRFLVYPSATDSQEIPVRAKVRGNFRRQRCRLPPLKLNFKDEDVAGTFMDGIDKIKLVIPCRWKSDRYEELILKEYLMYRMYNQLTDSSFHVRLLQVTFRDSADKYDTFTHYGFFIEPVDNLEARLQGEESEREGIHPRATNAELTSLMSVYHYMVGNTDWSIPGMHNVKMIKTDSFQLPLVIPYDFDWCGAIDAPYAQPSPKLGIQSVTQRVYRGFCRPEAEMNRVFDRFLTRKEQLYAQVNACTPLPQKERERLIDYLEEFYDVLASDRNRNYVFMQNCRR